MTKSNIGKYKADLERLIADGEQLEMAMNFECYPQESEEQLKTAFKKPHERKEFKDKLPNFRRKYQSWYSEALAVVKFLLPDRLSDFVKLYEKPGNRKDIAYGNYVIADYLQSLRVTTGLGDIKVDKTAALPQFQQQLNILRSARTRFESSLFDIKQLIQADLLDDELSAARELNRNGFARGAGAVAGVALEKHLAQVCSNHSIGIGRKNPHISDFNNKLKDADVIDTPTWRGIQRLADLRNLCDHNKESEPTKDNVEELIGGVDKVVKTLF